MKKKEVIRAYKFSDAKLVSIASEKISFFRRDEKEFNNFGISPKRVDELEAKVKEFSNFSSDGELLSNQIAATALKDEKVQELKTAISQIMARAELLYGAKSPKYKKFGASAPSREKNAELFMMGKRVVRVGTILLPEMVKVGLTEELLDNVTQICNAFEEALIEAGIKSGERDILQLQRVEQSNTIYNELVKYASTGQAIWGAVNPAKYNDYILYNTPTGTSAAAETTV